VEIKESEQAKGEYSQKKKQFRFPAGEVWYWGSGKSKRVSTPIEKQTAGEWGEKETNSFRGERKKKGEKWNG